MAHSLTSGMITATTAASLAPVIFCEIDTPSGNVYVWTGYGSLSWNGQTWTGLGDLVSMGPATETTQLQAVGLVLTLTGVPLSQVSIALISVKRNYPVKLWLGALTSSFAVIADPFQFFQGRVDSCSITESGKDATIQLTAEGRLVSMKIPRERHYTDQDQRIERPADGGFKFVDFIQNSSIDWGSTGAAQS